MSKSFKRVALVVLCAILAACSVAVGVIFGVNFKNSKGGLTADSTGGNNASNASLAVEATLNTNFDYEIILKGTPAEMAAGWDEAISYAGSRVLVTLVNDWTAQPHTSYGTSFGLASADTIGGGELYVPSGVVLTLNLNGHTIDRALTSTNAQHGNAHVIWVAPGGTLNLIDGSGNDSGKITGCYGQDDGGGIWVEGAFNMYGGTITGNYGMPDGSCGGVFVEGTFNMYGGKITGNGLEDVSSTYSSDFPGGGVLVNYVTAGAIGTFNMYGGEISNNKATWGGGVAVYGRSATVRATFNMYGGKIINNSIGGRKDQGAGVYVYNYADMVMNGGEISGNKALEGAGGGVAVGAFSTFEMNGGKITDNQALATDYANATATSNKNGAGGGGVIVENSSSMWMNGGEISYNYGLEGSAVKVVYKSDFTMNGGLITRNLSMPGGWTGPVSVGYANTSSTLCSVALNGGIIADNNLPYKDYTFTTEVEGLALARYSVCTIGGPIVFSNNTSLSNDDNFEFWVYGASQIAVNGPLYQNGQAAQIGLGVSTTVSTSANVVSGVTAANLCNYASTEFFICQNSGKYFNTVSNNLRLAADSLGTSYFKWSYKTDGDWINLDERELYARLSYGEKVTAVKAELTNTAGTNYVYSWPNGTDGGSAFDIVSSYVNNTENTNVTDVSKVGTYTFYVNVYNAPITGCANYTGYNSFRFEIVPKDITVVINNDNAYYGDGVTYNNGYNVTPEADGTVKGGWQLADGSTLASGDSYADLGITLGSFVAGKPNALSLNVGSFAITALSTTNNYNITFVNAVYTIKSRPITVILHNDEAEYTEKVELVQAPVTAAQDDDGYYINGGWHYADDSLQIVSGDIVNGKYPLVLTSSAVVSSGYTAVGEYSIYANFTNTNYTVTILNSDGSEPDAGDVASGTFTVTGATITVKSATAYDPENLYDTKKYDGSAQSIEIPQGAITLKGGVTSATVKYVVFEKDDEDIPEELPEADDTTFWTGAPTSATKTSAGEYVVYSLITADNHEPLVYKWTFSIGKSKASFELVAKHNGVQVEKDDSNAYKVTYDGVAVIVSISFTTTGVTTTNCPVLIYYKGTNSGNTYGSATDADFPDDSGTTDNGAARNLGNSNAPTEAGTYRATVIADPDGTSDYILDSASDATFTFTIDAKKVALPTSAMKTGSTGTYNGNTQTINYTYDTAAVKITACTGISETVDGVLKTYKDLTQGASNANAATKQTTTEFTATNAGTYAVKFDLTSTRNYKWDIDDTTKETSAQIITSAIKKAQLDFTLVSPVLKDGNEVWQWDAGTEADNGITAKAGSLTGNIGSDVITFDVSWYKYSSGTAGALNPVQTGIAYDALDVAISSFTEQASYFLLIQVAAGSTSNSNDNYCLKQNDTHFTPNLEGVKTREIVVGAGKVDVSRIVWEWQLEGSGADPVAYVKNAENADDNTKLVYTTKTVSGAITATNYIISADLSDLDYLEIDTTKGTDGYENYKYSAAGTYTLKLYIKIKDGSSYEFDTGDKDTYDADTTTTACVEFEWVINKKTISFTDDDGNSLVKWAYYLSDGSDIPSTTPGSEETTTGWTVFSEKNNPTYTGESVYVKISDEYLKGLGLTLSDVRVSYTANSKSTANSEQTTTATVQISGDTAKNYQLATGSVPAFKWTIGNTKITISGWDDETGRDLDDGNGNVFTLPGVKIDADDEETAEKLAGFIEYKYTYTFVDGDGNTVTREDVDEQTMMDDLFAIADQNGQPINISVKAELTEDGKKTYDIDFESGVENSFTSSIGDSKIKIHVSLENESSVYGDIKLNIKAVYYNDNDTSNPARDFDGQYLEVTITTADGAYTFKLSEISSYTLYIKDAGEYKLTFKVDESRRETYKLANSSVTFTVLPKQIAVPEITGEIVFAGKNIDLKEYLDANYAEYSDQEIVQWTSYDTDCYHVGTYNAVLTIVNANYVWAEPENAGTATKSHVRYTVVDNSIAVGTDKINATYSWEIKPFVLEGSSLWNTSGKEGASLNLPEWVVALMSGENPTLGIEYAYRTDKASPAVDPEWKGGNTYFVSATLNGADAQDFVFANETQTSEMVSYTVPQSGAAAFFNNVGSFVKNNWLWFVIGGAILLFLILLIIIIAVARKKKKKKAAEEEAKKEKEEAKAAAAAAAGLPVAAMAGLSMADEKAKLEAEKAKMEAELAKAKMEAEAEAAKAKAQAELDLQKAKMEAELAKIRAEAEAQAKQAQQPAPQPAQQPVQQPQAVQPVQQQNNVDANILAELKAEVAALRAEHRMAQSQYPQPMYAPQPQYLPQPAQGGDVNAELRARLAEERAKSAEERLFRSTEERAMLAEDRLLRGGYPLSQLAYQPNNLPAVQGAAGNNAGAAPSDNADVLGAVLASMVRNLASSPALPQEQKKSEAPQIIEAESQPVAVNTPTMYPPDAVITTTTTVDTTNRGKIVNGGDRGDESIFDIDGFYDKFDESK